VEIDLRTAQDAKNLTNSPAYVKTINKIDAELMAELLRCDASDKDMTQTLTIKIQQFNKIKSDLKRESELLLIAQQKAEIEAEKIRQEAKPIRITR